MAEVRVRRSAKTGNSALLWEALRLPVAQAGNSGTVSGDRTAVVKRLPFDSRCAARTKDGRRCRCKVRWDADYCPFHDPSITAEVRRAKARKAAQSRRARPALPKGYPRRLNTPEAARVAMERLYLETRVGLVTPRQARALLKIIDHLLNSLPDGGSAGATVPGRGDAPGRGGQGGTGADRARASGLPVGPGQQLSIVVRPAPSVERRRASAPYPGSGRHLGQDN
jgi:hypothetical protein